MKYPRGEPGLLMIDNRETGWGGETRMFPRCVNQGCCGNKWVTEAEAYWQQLLVFYPTIFITASRPEEARGMVFVQANGAMEMILVNELSGFEKDLSN